jgi:hypothetical protein
MTLAALPTELQELIISFLDQQHDLASLSLTSHHFRSLTDRQLYRTIHLKTTVQAGLFSRAVKQQSRAQIVRHLLLDVYETDFRIYDWAARRLSQEHNKDVDLYLRGRNFGSRVLGLFKNIEVLNIHAVAWPFDQVRAVLESVETSEGLNALRSCKLHMHERSLLQSVILIVSRFTCLQATRRCTRLRMGFRAMVKTTPSPTTARPRAHPRRW